MDAFVSADALDISNYLYANVSSSGNFVEHFVMPVTGAESGGQPLTLQGLGSDLYLTVDATGTQNTSGTSFSLLNVTLWADAEGDNGAVSASLETQSSQFSNGQNNDVVLATGVLEQATLSPPDASGTRGAVFVATMNPTLDGNALLQGSIPQGSQLEIKLTTPAATFSSNPQPDGSVVNLVNGGTGLVTVDSGAIQIPNVALDLGSLRFLPPVS